MPEFKVTDHSLVPKQEILAKEEKEKILKKYNIVSAQLPKIPAGDPVVKELGGKAGDVIKIVRKSATAGVSEYYRVVVGVATE